MQSNEVRVPLAQPRGVWMVPLLFFVGAGAFLFHQTLAGDRVLDVAGAALDRQTSGILFWLLGLAMALGALNYLAKILSVRGVRPFALVIDRKRLSLPVDRFLRGVSIVRIPWSEVDDVTLRPGSAPSIEIATTSGRRFQLDAEWFSDEWPAQRVYSALHGD